MTAALARVSEPCWVIQSHAGSSTSGRSRVLLQPRSHLRDVTPFPPCVSRRQPIGRFRGNLLLRLTAATYRLVQGEAVVDAGRQGDHVPLSHGNADPSVLLVPDVEVAPAVQNVADLLVQVQVLLEEHLQLLVPKTHRSGQQLC